MSTIGRKLLSSVVYSGSVEAFMNLQLTPALFRDSEGLLYELIRDHLGAYGKLPDKATIEDTAGFADSLVEAPEPPKFYLAGVEKRYLQTSLKSFMNEAAAHMKEDGQDPEKAFEILINGVATTNLHRHRHNIIDFRDAATLIYQEYVKQHTMNDQAGLMFGWPTVDNLTGGAKPGDFISFIGRPSAGKTFKLLYNALNTWAAKRVPLFVSMEMNKVIITQRLAAMHSHKPMTHILKAELTTKAFKEMMDKLKSIKAAETPMWVVDANMAKSVDEIVLLAQQLHPAAVYVDGAYMLTHPNPRINRFERQTENAEWLKQRVATDLGVPVFASYQFGKQVDKMKKTKGDKAGLGDIYGSDAIAQLSTIVFGLMQDDGVETQISREVEIMKGRNGETGKFKIRWDFKGMDFTEIAPDNSQLAFCD